MGVLVLCDLKGVENELKTINVSDQISLGQNARFQKRAFSACCQDENDLYKKPDTVILRKKQR
jgi:hypothetical protein